MASKTEILAELLDVEARRRELQHRENELRDRLLLAEEAPDVSARVEAGGAVHPQLAFTLGATVLVIQETSPRYGHRGEIVQVYSSDVRYRFVLKFTDDQRLAFSAEELAKANDQGFAARIAAIRRAGQTSFNEARQIALDEQHGFAIEYRRAVEFLSSLAARVSGEVIAEVPE